MNINLINQVSIQYTEADTLKLFNEKLINSEGNNVTEVDWFTIGGSRLPVSEKIVDLKAFPVLL